MGFYPDAEGASSWEREGVADWEDFDEEAYARREVERREEEREYEEGGRRGSAAQRTPLLTDIEAPSVTEALREEEEGVEIGVGEGEGRRPKSGMRNAFMNMANSIMYV